MKTKGFDRIKTMKKISREETKLYGKSGVHIEKGRKRKQSTREYMEEVEDENEEEIFINNEEGEQNEKN